MVSSKTLIIVRHGKSSWDYESLADIDRPLKERGVRDAFDMAGRMKKQGLIPQRIITSSAIRAIHTAIIFSRILEVFKEKIIICEELFHADASEIVNIIGTTPADIDSLMIFGHNPGFTRLVNILSNLSISNLPTSGMVLLVFNTDNWKRIGRNNLIDEKFDFPSNE